MILRIIAVVLGFIQLFAFRANWDRLGLTDEDLRSLEALIDRSPTAAPVMRGTGGLRKTRLSIGGSGKSGGARVCYVYFEQYGLVYLWAVYAKNEQSNLSAADRNGFRILIAKFGQFLAEHFVEGRTP